MTQSRNPTEVLLRGPRLSYPHLHAPRSFQNDPTAPAKYSCSLLIPKSDKESLNALQAAAKAAIAKAVPTKFNGKTPATNTLRMPWTDGDAVDEDGSRVYGDECTGCYILKTSSPANRRPRVVTTNPKVEAVEEDVWAGQEVNALVSLSAYNMGANRGVSAYINAVQLTGRGERIDGRSNPEDVFSDLGGASNDGLDDDLLGSFDDAACSLCHSPAPSGAFFSIVGLTSKP